MWVGNIVEMWDINQDTRSGYGGHLDGGTSLRQDLKTIHDHLRTIHFLTVISLIHILVNKLAPINLNKWHVIQINSLKSVQVTLKININKKVTNDENCMKKSLTSSCTFATYIFYSIYIQNCWYAL